MTKQILIVDDEERIRELVQACLEDLGGWETITTSSGEKCLKIVQQEKFDAILLDVSMPGMDGFAVFQQLQANPIAQSIPVILLTARVLPSDRDRFTKMGVAGVIAKPIEPMTLTTEIIEILGWEES
ncbi:MAG TPA: two-component system response regulator [Cyanobacteria bacterium UBA11149]|nr:two-component system response regulator [Cyanobacteria bacterium UBA11367]HBE58708.1 two-component system response regulator [Cyanobacteria bacterium UBA11366]HBK66212.1 two-component system response regulator [Cyanobacteria bacterium UBA11166]HBR74765.1 two-component system response regulator [Cyanobacteria bacterium UBA11159]HBS72301.1 two-component system response regulator [Cyanobacteria bacterium UBA11153]HBW90493.1 two-component system response regulator [Cyanobacteria bacterium UBA11